MKVGRHEIHALLDCAFALDGGAMFGTVPRTRWELEAEPDARHRVRLASRCLLALDRDAGKVVLVDAGLGEVDLERAERWAVARGGPGAGLVAGLARLGLVPEDVTDLVLTHLHHAHAGGVLRRGADGSAHLAFPRAVHHVQREHWLRAHTPSDREASSFPAEVLDLLQHSNALHLLDGDASPLPDVELVVSEGHTPGQQLTRFRGDGTHLVFCGDLVPTHFHLRPTWISAYDLQPLTAVEEKRVLVAEALEEGGVLALAHDPVMAACRLGEDEGVPVFREAVAL